MFCRSYEEYSEKPWEWISLPREEFTEGRKGAQGEPLRSSRGGRPNTSDRECMARELGRKPRKCGVLKLKRRIVWQRRGLSPI